MTLIKFDSKLPLSNKKINISEDPKRINNNISKISISTYNPNFNSKYYAFVYLFKLKYLLLKLFKIKNNF